MNGAGNAILVLDLRGSSVRPTAEDARAIHRAPGLSYDQMMVLRDPKTAAAAADVLIYNNDGTLAGACGNGTRCVADLLCREFGADAVKIETEAGVIPASGSDPGPIGSTWARRASIGTPFRFSMLCPTRGESACGRKAKLWPASGPLPWLTWATRMWCSSSQI